MEFFSRSEDNLSTRRKTQISNQKEQMEFFSRGEDNLSTRRKTQKANQKGRWSSLVVVKTTYLREGKLRNQTKRADGILYL